MSPLPPDAGQAASYVALEAGAATSSPEAEEVSVSTIAATAAATGHLMFKIEGYKRLKEMHGENGTYIESPASMVGGHAWTIRFYLNGDRKEDAGFVSLYLHLCNYYATEPAVHAEYELSLVPHGPHQGTSAAYGHRGKPSSVHIFGGKDMYSGWGGKRFISVKELEQSVFLKDDCFAVRCTVTVVEERTVKEEAVQAGDLARLGMLCKCDDELCKRHHDRPAAARTETLLERIAKFCYSICRGPGR